MYGKYRVIRTSDDYRLVVIHCCLEQGHDQYYLYDQTQPIGSLLIGEAAAGRHDDFEQIEKAQANVFLSSNVDAIGFGEVNKETMDSLYEVWTWIRSKQTEVVQQRRVERLATAERERLELLDSLMRAGPSPTKDEFRELLAENGNLDEWPEFEKRYEQLFRKSVSDQNNRQDAI